MQLIFFDLECANCNGGNGKICSFGYCHTDANFSVLEQRDILINPKAEFILPPTMRLAYSFKTFRKQPSFEKVYSEIKKLLGGGAIIFGHALYNDARYLQAECKRYNLEPIDFTFYDTQLMYMHKNQLKSQIGLDKIMQDLNFSGTFHKSDEDAYMSMLTLKSILANKNLIGELENFSSCKGSCINGEILLPPIIDLPPSNKKILNAIYILEQNKDTYFTENFENPFAVGKKFMLDKESIKKDPSRALYILDKLKAGGGLIENKKSASDFIVLSDNCQIGNKENRITFSQLESYLGISGEHERFNPKPYIKMLKKQAYASKKQALYKS